MQIYFTLLQRSLPLLCSLCFGKGQKHFRSLQISLQASPEVPPRQRAIVTDWLLRGEILQQLAYGREEP